MTILVIDSNFLGFRAHYTTGQLSFGDQHTGVIYGFLNQTLTLMERFLPDRVVFCWDSKRSLRKQVFPGYKAKRKQKSQEEQEQLNISYTQFSLLRNTLLPQMGFRNIFMETGYESDDLIASITIDWATMHEDSKSADTFSWMRDMVIVSSDEDLYQLLDCAVIYNPAKDETTTFESFQDHYHLFVEQWPQVKAIAGCLSDSIPGVPGIGIQRAIDYLHGELPPGGIWEKAIESDEGVALIERNLPLVTLPYLDKRFNLTIQRDELNEDGLVQLCEDCGFREMLRDGTIPRWRAAFADSRE